jgi:acyl carrier protein
MKSVTKEELIEVIKKLIAEECQISYSQIDINLDFSVFKMDSIEAIAIMLKLEEFLDAELSPLHFRGHPTIYLLASFLFEHYVNNKTA